MGRALCHSSLEPALPCASSDPPSLSVGCELKNQIVWAFAGKGQAHGGGKTTSFSSQGL